MRAIINNDLIISFTINENAGYEIGTIPKGVDLSLLRFNGQKVIDIRTLSTLWVEAANGGFTLHSKNVGNPAWPNPKPCTEIEMAYTDRHRLFVDDSGVIRLRTTQEQEDFELAEKKKLIKQKLVSKMRGKFGYVENIQVDTLVLVAALIVYARKQPQALQDFFDDIIPGILNTFPLHRWEDLLRDSLVDLKTFLTEYYSELDELEP